mmetsp:Transcript_1468/g.2260  ORF Transcript_1468/g.2260 Transcript_1468/m.2260 type:complete len:101 (-) Transcript_1468:783-1085(-)
MWILLRRRERPRRRVAIRARVHRLSCFARLGVRGTYAKLAIDARVLPGLRPSQCPRGGGSAQMFTALGKIVATVYVADLSDRSLCVDSHRCNVSVTTTYV